MTLRHIFAHWTYETFPPGAIIRSKYNAFARIMREDETCLGIIAEIEDIHARHPMADWSKILHLTFRLDLHVRKMLDHLQRINPLQFMDIMDYASKTSFYMRMAVSVADPEISPPFVFPLAEAFKRKKHANYASTALSRIMAASSSPLPIPRGFVISSSAYHYFIEANDLRPKIDKMLREINLHHPEGITHISRAIQEIIMEAPIPDSVADALEIATLDLVGGSGTVDMDADPRCTPATLGLAAHHVRLSGITLSGILQAWKECLLVKYRPQCISERIEQGLADSEAPMVVMVQAMTAHVESGWFRPEPTRAALDLPERTRQRDMVSIISNVSSSREETATMLLARDEGHRVLLHPEPAFMSPHNAKQLTMQGLAIQDLLPAPHAIGWLLDTRHRLWITSALPLETRTSNRIRFDKTLELVSRLTLTPIDPTRKVTAKHIRSMYDIISFAREKGIKEMFGLVNRSGLGLEGAKLLDRPPVRIWILNLAGGFFPTAAGKSHVGPNEFKSIPMWALWFGMESSLEGQSPASETAQREYRPLLYGHAILSRTYLHVSLHANRDFAEIDTVCGQDASRNHIGFRYKSTVFSPPSACILQMETMLQDHGFTTNRQGNMIEARCENLEETQIQKRLAVLGRLIAKQGPDAAMHQQGG
ncbi:PEP/pyruvate-binding domain-containing protein [Desulfoplanes formicivorans]|uniref:Phosphoenolpyruvate synthase n=1 Tax=Desulfoplanes formicivorans TaxID=1592317 RepID=A0A194AL48_9BACT|nr:PEP/pyruvate-binding domain-containing protein [Desulfoplanes formicivorans]GAU09409.1 pyruvate, phosphate dikinase [Desulfoplanes formicivorans]